MAALKKGQLPHAFLFSGDEGVGKKSAAGIFAMACNCAGNQAPVRRTDDDQRPSEIRNEVPCGICRPCKKITSGNHPDYHIIRPSGAFIQIDQIRTLCRTLALKPYEATVRVVVISDAQRMNPESANALLKILEEPPDHTLFILTATRSADLLPTIVSRCRIIRFNPISQNGLEKLLVETYQTEAKAAAIIAAQAGGSVTRALEIKEQNWIERRNQILSGLRQLEDKTAGAGLAFSAALASQPDQLKNAFEIMKSWYRDLAVYRYAPDKIANRDLIKEIQSVFKKYPLPSVVEKITAVEHAQWAVGVNANVRLTLDALVIKLAQ